MKNDIEKIGSEVEEDATAVKSCSTEENKATEGEESQGEVAASTDMDQTPGRNQAEDQKDLRDYERAIHSFIQKGRTVGAALKAIRDRHLYKLKGYRSFRRYCLKEFDITATHAYRMIAHYDVCVLLKVPPEDVPEKTTRSLSELRATDEEKKLLWVSAIGDSTRNCPTTEAIRRCVAEFKRTRNAPVEPLVGGVYIKKFGEYISRENLETELLSRTQNAVDLIQLVSEVNEYLPEESRTRLKQACITRLDEVFAL